MAFLYLHEQGSSLHVIGERFIVHKNKETILDLPYFNIERVMIFGNVQLTAHTSNFLLEHSIPCSFFSTRGKYYGMLYSYEPGHVFLRVCQYERYLDYNYRLSMAKRIVNGKIKNQIDYLTFFNTNHKSDFLSQMILLILGLKESLNSLTKIDGVMGIEGKASTFYFSCFKEIIRKNFTFVGRNRQPPKDPVNSLLSLSLNFRT